MIELDRVVAIKRKAEARFLVLPGVHGVGVGPKLVDGKSTGELAIKVYLVEKRSPELLRPGEVIPAEVEGVKTDVVQMELPTLHADNARERPLIFGTMITPKDGNERGSLGFLARTNDSPAKLVALTCQHVIAPPMGLIKSQLDVNNSDPQDDPFHITLTGDNTTATLVVVGMASQDQGKMFNAFWRTLDTDTPDSIADKLITVINGITAAGVTAVKGGVGELIISANPGSDTFVGRCSIFDPIFPDNRANLSGSPDKNQVIISGVADREYGVFVSWNTTDGPTNGVFVPVVKNTLTPTIASNVVQAIQKLAVPGISASVPPGGTVVTINGAAITFCQIANDIRIGQANDDFSSNCSLCCTDEFGRVSGARIDLDAALIQLRRGLEYKGVIKGDPSKSKPPTLITGIVQDELVKGYAVHLRGATSLWQDGKIDSVEFNGYGTNSTPFKNWTVFYRSYGGAIVVKGDDGRFSDDGDSGGPVFNDAGEIVGLLFAGGPSRSIITPVTQLMPAMGLTLAVEPNTDTHKVSDAEGALAMMRADGDLFAAPVRQAHAELIAIPEGKELAEAVGRNVQEIQTLVNTNPRVATAWHRNGGPRLAEIVLKFLVERSWRLPEEVEGLSLATRLKNLQVALTKHGSESLAADLEQYGPRILSLIGLSFSEVLDRIGGQLATV